VKETTGSKDMIDEPVEIEPWDFRRRSELKSGFLVYQPNLGQPSAC